MDDLLIINTDQVSVKDFNADHSIQLWWKSKTRRLNQQPRKKYRKKTTSAAASTSTSTVSEGHSMEGDTSDGSAEESSDNLLLEDWDNWIDY